MSSESDDFAPIGRLLVPARTAWSQTLAYSRAVRVGAMVFVSGTLAVDAQGQLVGGNDAQLQAAHVLRIIEAALHEAGSGLEDVVRLRIYLRDLADLPAVGRAQRLVFDNIRPACTVVQCQLANDSFRVQMEADAVTSNPMFHGGAPHSDAEWLR